MSKLLIHQEKSIIRSFWKPKRKCTTDKEYIESFSQKKKKKNWKIKRKKGDKKKRKKRRKKKRYYQKFIKREYNKDSLMRKKVNDTMKDNLGWLQHLVDDPCLKNKTQKKYFLSLYILFLHNPVTLATLQAQ